MDFEPCASGAWTTASCIRRWLTRAMLIMTLICTDAEDEDKTEGIGQIEYVMVAD